MGKPHSMTTEKARKNEESPAFFPFFDPKMPHLYPKIPRKEGRVKRASAGAPGLDFETWVPNELYFAANCRSTYCRMPPCWKYSISCGVSIRTLAVNSFLEPSEAVAVTRRVRPPANFDSSSAFK